MKKYASRMKIGRQKAARRMADPKRLKRRAQKQARNMLAKKLAKADYSSLSFSRKQEIEKRLAKMKPRLDRMAKKLLPKMRKLEQERKRGNSTAKLDRAIAKNNAISNPRKKHTVIAPAGSGIPINIETEDIS